MLETVLNCYPGFIKQLLKKGDIVIYESTVYPGATIEIFKPIMEKISGLKLCESFNRELNTDFRSVIPCNLYGPNDNYNLSAGHVFAALIKKFYLQHYYLFYKTILHL